MSDVVVNVVESATNVTVTEQDVAVDVTETNVQVSTNSVGLQGTPGVGYTGVTSTSLITIGAGLKTFTLVAGYQGAFLTGMRVRAIHSDTPTYYMEGTANYIGGGTLIITVDKFAGSGQHNLWAFAIAGELGQTGATGATGSSGVVSVTAPITNSGSAGSAIVGIDLTNIAQTNVANTFTGNTQTIATGSTAVVPLVINQPTNNAANIAEFKINNSNNARISPNGSIATAGNLAVGAVAITNANQFQVSTTGTAQVGAVIRGFASQSANLQEWQNTGGTVLSRVSSSGQIVSDQQGYFGSGAASISNARFNVATGGTAVIGAVVRGASGQSANLTEWQDSTGGTVALVSNTGSIRTNGAVAVGTLSSVGQFTVIPSSTATIGAVVRGAASQSANLTEWQNSGGTALASVGSGGSFLSTSWSSSNALTVLGETNSGGTIRFAKATAAAAPPSNQVRIQVLAGTTINTLKLVAVGPNGTAVTILDNLA